MLIECPSCHAQAQLPASKEGAKVRCGECKRIYTARVPGTRASKGPSGLSIGLGLGGVVVVALAAWFYNQAEPVARTRPVVQEPEPEAKRTDFTGWESAPVLLVRAVYRAVADTDRLALRGRLQADEAWAFVTNRDAPAETEPVAAMDYGRLNEFEQAQALDAIVASILASQDENALSKWRPVDGNVEKQDDETATVHVRVDKVDVSDGLETRTMAFQLVLDGEDWKLLSWQRYISPDEQKKMARPKRDYEKVELSDGSVLYQAEPRPLEYDEATPAEQRKEIDALYAQMIDLEATTTAAEAREAIIAIGKPAIPKLLTGLYETPLESEDQAIQVNQIVIALREITGEYMGYKPMQLVGSTTGTTEERRQAAIKAWFAWWLRKGAKFEEKPEEKDLLEGLIELDEREKRELERDERSGG